MREANVIGLLLAIAISILFPSVNALAQSPGDTVGTTNYVYQCNGSTGHRIAVDSIGNVYFTWTRMANWSGPRQVYYNYFPLGIPDSPRGFPVRSGLRDGYPQLSLSFNGAGAIAFHQVIVQPDSSFLAIDAAPGYGWFNTISVPNKIQDTTFAWPYISIDRNDRIHIISTEANEDILPGVPRALAYTRYVDGDSLWTSLQRVDTIMTISAMITSSRYSDKVAIVYTHPFSLENDSCNDVYYIESPNGILWDWEGGKVNVTNYSRDTDSIYAWSEVDAIYDHNDNLHIVWNARRIPPDTSQPMGYLYHYENSIGAISEVTHYRPDRFVDMNHYLWNLPICKASITEDPQKRMLYTVYTRFDSSDYSSDGFANGEIYMQYSATDGNDWSTPQNLTNSHTPGCTVGNCASDLFPSLAEFDNGFLHVLYVCDNRGPDNALLYLKISPHILGASDQISLPTAFSLSQNYPNPFNASTTISFDLNSNANVNLSVYGITGAKIATLVDGRFNAGKHEIRWNALDVSSGIYYYKLTSGKDFHIKKMLLLK